MLEAVFFDWGDTLMQWTWDPDLLEAGHRAGLAALGRDDLPDPAAVTERFREVYEPLLKGCRERRRASSNIPSLVQEPADAAVGVARAAGELDRFLRAEHTAWAPALQLGNTTHALLESLRSRGLKLGLVSNALDPPWLLHADLEALGIAERLDVAVFSSEVGVRKPHPAIFERALDELGVAPGEALFVGDRLVRGTSAAPAGNPA